MHPVSRTLEFDARNKQARFLRDAAHDRLVRQAQRAASPPHQVVLRPLPLLARLRTHWFQVWSRIRARAPLSPLETRIDDVVPPIHAAHP
jgi:hypothetical protein